jgi:hypothetical protein
MSPDERAAAAIPTAAALVCAVADHDPDEVARLLGEVTDWHALAVVLAGHVPADSAILGPTGPLTHDDIAQVLLEETARRFRITVEQIRSTDRRREVVDARAVAMAAMRYAGLSSPYIGKVMDRDHSTVLHAAGRVGETARLRRIAVDIAALTGVLPGVLADAGETRLEVVA